MSTRLPALLYHGSAYRQDELMPGFQRSHEEVRWDQGESNRFLYATTEKEVAIALGFGSALEKRFPIDRFVVADDNISVYIDAKELPLLKASVVHLAVYLYTISPVPSQRWIKNTNLSNGLTTEYKTAQTITALETVQCVDLPQWLSKRSFHVIASRPNWERWWLFKESTMSFQTPPPQQCQSLNPQEYRYVVVVTGSRHYNDLREFHETLVEYLLRFDAPVLFVSGWSRPGPEDLIQRWARRFGYPCLPMPADWGANPKSAGYIRNEAMNQLATHVLAFDDGQSRESGHMIEIAVAAHRQVTLIHVTPTLPNPP